MINPSLVGLKEWADSLIVDYPDQNVPILLFEMDWQRWALELIKSSIFSESYWTIVNKGQLFKD